MLKKIAFTVYPVFDIERARKFYEKILKLKISKISTNSMWIEYDLPKGGCFALTSMLKEFFPNNNSVGNIAFEVDNLCQFMKNLKKMKLDFKHDIFSTPVCKIATIKDSEGNNIMLHQIKNKK